jgi:hypothetical protein
MGDVKFQTSKDFSDFPQILQISQPTETPTGRFLCKPTHSVPSLHSFMPSQNAQNSKHSSCVLLYGIALMTTINEQINGLNEQ